MSLLNRRSNVPVFLQIGKEYSVKLRLLIFIVTLLKLLFFIDSLIGLARTINLFNINNAHYTDNEGLYGDTTKTSKYSPI